MCQVSASSALLGGVSIDLAPLTYYKVRHVLYLVEFLPRYYPEKTHFYGSISTYFVKPARDALNTVLLEEAWQCCLLQHAIFVDQQRHHDRERKFSVLWQSGLISQSPPQSSPSQPALLAFSSVARKPAPLIPSGAGIPGVDSKYMCLQIPRLLSTIVWLGPRTRQGRIVQYMQDIRSAR